MSIKTWFTEGMDTPLSTPHPDIPFAHTVYDDQRRYGMEWNRIQRTLKFMRRPRGRVLHVGGEGMMGKLIRATWGTEYDGTNDTDFNDEISASPISYDVVLCFEVLEHVMNPLNAMRDIYRLLIPGGVCYLSTPILGWIPIFHTNLHFTEYQISKLKILFEYAGFEIVRQEAFNPVPAWAVFTGVRPIVRYLFQRIVLYELRRPT